MQLDFRNLLKQLFSKHVLLRLFKKDLNHLNFLIRMREGSENLDMDVLSLSDLNLHKEIGASNNLRFDTNGVIMREFFACHLFNLRSQVIDHCELFLCQT